MEQQSKIALLLGTLILGLAVIFGAFGAHALKSLVTPELLVTFETGVRYQFYHGFALLTLGLFTKLFPTQNLLFSLYAFAVGILLFSFNCYLYVLTGMKPFAMIIPIGGLLLILAWLNWSWKILRLR